MLNVTAMTGRLVETPELRHTENDNIPVTSFRLAVRRDFVRKGEADTDFFDVVAWRGSAEFISKYFKKGSLIQLTGRFQNRKWKDKHDQNRVTTELHVSQAYFGDSKDKDGDNGGLPDDIDPFEGDVPSSDALAPDAPPDFDPFG